MFSGLKRLLGNITVDEVGSEVRVEGVDMHVMASHIRGQFATGKIAKHMFTRMDRSSFAFPSFFLPDVVHMLEIMAGLRSLKVPMRTLIKIRDLLVEETWLKNTLEEPYSKLDYSKLSNMTLTPLAFQSEFFKSYDRLTGQYGLNGFLLAGAAGSGKTFTSLALSEMVDVDYVIVVCPKNALDRVWRKSISGDSEDKSKFKQAPSAWYYHDGKPYNNERFLIGHYESIDELREVAKRFRGKNVMVVLDESHNLNNDKSLRTSRFVDLCLETDSRDVIWLSGTPIKALAVEAIPLLRCIDPLFTDDVQARFRKIYNDNKGKAVDILQCRMGLISFIVEKSELGLKDPIFQEIKVKLPHGDKYTLPEIKKVMLAFVQEREKYYASRKKEDQRFFDSCLALYEKTLQNDAAKQGYANYQRCLQRVIKAQGDFAVKDEMALCNRYEINIIQPALPKEMRAEWKSVRSIIKYVHLKIQGECLGRVVGGLRIQCHVDMVESVDFKAVCESSQKKTVVFTSFVDVIERCADVMPKLNLNPLFVSAKTNKNLNSIIRVFEQEEDANPLVATYASLSTAVPLVMADTMILFDSPFRDYILQQAVSRIHRLDGDSQTYIYTVSLDTGDEVNISSRSMDILKWSQSQVESILGIKSPFEIKDDLEAFGIALEGLDEEAITSAKAAPRYLSW